MLVQNAVYQFVEQSTRIRIIYVAEQEDLCAYVNVEANIAVPVLESIIELEKNIENNNIVEILDPFIKIIEESSLSEYVKEKRNQNWNIIQQYWEWQKIELINRSTRMNIFKKISSENNVPLMTVRRMFSRFWQRGMSINACILDYSNSGAPGKDKKYYVKTGRPRIACSKDENLGINVDNIVKNQFAVALNKYFRNKQRKSLTAVYQQLLEDFYSVPIKEQGKVRRILINTSNIPTYEQFYYWYRKNRNTEIDMKKRFGDKAYELTNRPILGDARMEAPGPGFRFQIDATPDNFYIVSEMDRSKIIGRATIYLIIDVYSRLITGVYVGLENNSWNGARLAIDSIVADKKELCAEYGITIDAEQWPCMQLPEIIIADRGEMLGHGVANLINNFNVTIENTTAYRGDLKGIVERLFRTITEKTKTFLPGGIMSDFRKRGEPDYRLDAKLTLREARKVILLLVLEHNLGSIDDYQLTPEMVRDGIKPIPLEIWNWGIANQKGCLRKIDQLTFRLGILPRAKATINRGVVIFYKLSYGAPELVSEYIYLAPFQNKVEVIYDPQNLKSIYLVNSNNGGYLLLNLLEKDRAFAGFSLDDVIEANKKAIALKRIADDEQLAFSVQINQEIKKIALDATKAADSELNRNITKTERLKNIRANRAEEKAMQRSREAFISSPNKKEAEEDTPSKTTDMTKVDENLFELMRRRRNELLGE